ncbi:hypothetical protein CGCF413_v007096 [Colletotrichum fructicola]|nr:hypothetical protein CGCF413_v007096 [Colletotrichum fructicola]
MDELQARILTCVYSHLSLSLPPKKPPNHSLSTWPVILSLTPATLIDPGSDLDPLDADVHAAPIAPQDAAHFPRGVDPAVETSTVEEEIVHP